MKDYLDYAENGSEVLGRSAEASGGEIESPFEQAVKNSLEREGYNVETQIGVGGYRIDLAIRDSENPGKYKLGIECDGATYHSSYTARTRDRLRQQILEDKYRWKIHRIWSRDWVQDPVKQIEKIKELLNRPEEPILSKKKSSLEYTVEDFVIDEESVTIEDQVKSNAENYVYSDNLDWSTFRVMAHYGMYNANMAKIVGNILENNIAVTQDKLFHVIAAFFGHQRLTQRQRRDINSSINRFCKNVSFNEETKTYTKAKFKWKTFKLRFNLTENEFNNRKNEDIPPEEYGLAGRAILKELNQIPYDDLMTEIARLFNFGVTGRKIRESVTLGIDWAIEEGHLESFGENMLKLA